MYRWSINRNYELKSGYFFRKINMGIQSIVEQQQEPNASKRRDAATKGVAIPSILVIVLVALALAGFRAYRRRCASPLTSHAPIRIIVNVRTFGYMGKRNDTKNQHKGNTRA